MHIDPHSHLQEHHRRIARVTEAGLRRVGSTSNVRPRPARVRLTDRIPRRRRELAAPAVAQ